MTAEMAKALRDGYPRGLFVSIDHPDGTGYFWSGVGSRDWNGHTWAGVGRFGGVSPVKQSTEIAVQEILFTLSGLDSSIVDELSDDIRNRVGEVWLACLNWDDSIVRDPYSLLTSELDFQTYDIADDGTATIQITGRSGFYTLDRGIEEAWTTENQKRINPDDTGMDYIPSLQNQDLPWTPI